LNIWIYLKKIDGLKYRGAAQMNAFLLEEMFNCFLKSNYKKKNEYRLGR